MKLACLDINECSEKNGGCNHICNNTPGSYHCSCNNGCYMERDGRTCTGDHVFVITGILSLLLVF
jgi:Coagulation Factor Xa inhibitory site